MTCRPVPSPPASRRAPPSLAAAAGIVLALTGCGGAVPTTFDLTALPGAARAGAARRSIVVAEPVGIQPFEADRIIVRAGGTVSFLGGGQWADRLPRLIQTRLIQSLENAGRLRSVGRPGDKVAADIILVSDIRAFDIVAPSREAVVDLSVKLVQDSTGTVTAARVFQARVPVEQVAAPQAANGLDRALSIVLADVVRWVGAGG
ncbi:ABC-type transport auxiliary lipoprotein family protein [uncultured Methylobacterium sp.]|uniref:ABC-type transport auxiliary lipoprotein family protein n=1 Tax=uncultured Methylobacterium sp. TaxID=157278 RepID=UPI002625CC80|nr:ABC-type transport auxiliary lipoprotein family protein [uncultured Methylobacterium sp.]